ncbi:MAG: DUF6782 family putative metallopeptidase [Micavibrio sp.]
MANSQPRLWRKGTLCGAFLGAAMAMTSCAHQPSQTGSPLPPTGRDPNALVTGEENMKDAIRFSEIDRRGDPRIKRIIARLRQSTLGEEMYQYAVDKNLSFQWETGVTTRKGAYYFNNNRIHVDVNHTDDGVISTLSHEIRHSWHDNTLNIPSWKLDPIGKWQAWQFMEADSCAFNAHFNAEYQRETGHTLVSRSTFSASVTNSYAKKDPQTRNYMKDALEPCFALVVQYYQDEHLEVLRTHQKGYTESFNRAAQSGRYNHALRSYFNPATPDEKAALFTRFMNLTLDPQKALPASSRPQDVLQWVGQHSSYKAPKDEAELNAMQLEFQRMRARIVQELR